MKSIAFIINPISGAKGTQHAKHSLPELIMRTLDLNQWQPEIIYTEYAGHATELAQQFVQRGFDAVVSVGGDGTLNEVARGVRDTRTAIGILPMGSGNGFARHLHIPINIKAAIERLNYAQPTPIDYGLANDELFVSTCGAGFDAVIADHFASSTTRGFMTYLKNILGLAFTYHSESYHVVGEGIDETHKAFLVTIANANQWGYGALIAPRADLQDGQMDIMMMSRHAILGALPLAIRLFAGNIDRSPLMHTIRANDITLVRERKAPFHIDGSPVTMPKDIRIRIVHGGLYVLA